MNWISQWLFRCEFSARALIAGTFHSQATRAIPVHGRNRGVDQQVDVARLSQRDLAICHLCENGPLKSATGIVFFEKFVNAQLLADEVQHVL